MIYLFTIAVFIVNKDLFNVWKRTGITLLWRWEILGRELFHVCYAANSLSVFSMDFNDISSNKYFLLRWRVCILTFRVLRSNNKYKRVSCDHQITIIFFLKKRNLVAWHQFGIREDQNKFLTSVIKNFVCHSRSACWGKTTCPCCQCQSVLFQLTNLNNNKIKNILFC